MDTTFLAHAGMALGIAGFWAAAWFRFRSQRHVIYCGRDLGCENAVGSGSARTSR